jgi:anti-sigma factor RsiW
MMSECEYRSRLDAFHDGELDAQTHEQFERHLETCPECAAEVRELRRVARMFDALAEDPMSASALARVHQAVDQVDDEPPLGILRIAAVLTALAASVLVIGSAWLWEAPGAGAQLPRVVVYHPQPTAAWERVALTLEPDHLPRTAWEVGDRTRLAETDARLADWMLDNLNARQPQREVAP